MAYQYVLSMSLIFTVVLIFGALGVAVWSWGCFLDNYEHDPGRVRAWMAMILLFTTMTELGLASSGIVHNWVVVFSLVANFWGGLDAVLRYPKAHDLESFFSVKQFFLLTVKTFAYAFGIVSFRMHIVKFLLVLLFNTWGLPVLYLMALPLDACEMVTKDDEYDVDLAVRVWQLTLNPIERRKCMMTCKSWWYRKLSTASESSSLARNLVLCSASPEYRRTLQRRVHGGRSV
mmetsp:Transcript_10825/g.28954  ORF Transcript_10825/g.28954 Transcript_10825/m.28954 type:complete len:232 (-) Transcript_10825:784-1479(-)